MEIGSLLSDVSANLIADLIIKIGKYLLPAVAIRLVQIGIERQTAFW